MPTTRSARRAERNNGVRSGIVTANSRESATTVGVLEVSAAAGECIPGPPPSSSGPAAESSFLREVFNEFRAEQRSAEERMEARFAAVLQRQREELYTQQQQRDAELRREIQAAEQRFRQTYPLSAPSLPTIPPASVASLPSLPPASVTSVANSRPVPPLLPLSDGAPITTSAPRSHSFSMCRETPKFDGKNWETFKIQFLALARVNGWDDTAKISFLLNSLKHRALSILPSLTETQCSDFIALFKTLENRFGHLRSHQLNVVAFNNYTQTPGQSVQALAFEIERLVNLAYPDVSEEMKDDLATARFLAALMDNELKRQLLLANVSGLQQTLSKAVEIELINKTFSAKSSASTSAPLSSSSSSSFSGKRRFTQSNSDSNKQKMICFECGKPGHTKAKCFTLHPELKKFRFGDSNLNIKKKSSRVRKNTCVDSGNEEGRN